MHIKIIKGRKYYYESIRKGKKVTSRYVGPVNVIDARGNAQPGGLGGVPAAKKDAEEEELAQEEQSQEDYIG